MKITKSQNMLFIIICLNILIFAICNIIFGIKYEQIDDFIIYKLYSGLDGTNTANGIYMHPLICLVIGLFYRILPIINWHSIFLLCAQFICFTLIGYIILKKHKSNIAIILYAIFAGVFYSSLLSLIQYTSVAGLLIFTSFILLIDMIENKSTNKLKYKVLIFVLFTLGILTRVQSFFIIAPFMGIYFLVGLLQYKSKKEEFVELIKNYLIYGIILIIVFISNFIMCNSNNINKEYTKFNKLRTKLQDSHIIGYEENKEVFDEIGWSKNDWYLFYTFGMGDENIYSYKNLQKIVDYKDQKYGKLQFNINIPEIIVSFIREIVGSYNYIFLLLGIFLILNLLQKKDNKINLMVFVTTIVIHLLFIIMSRPVQRVILPAYLARNCYSYL